MSFIQKYWKVLLGVVLLLMAALILAFTYLPWRASYESQKQSLVQNIGTLQASIAENQKYESVQTELDAAKDELAVSRAKLYGNFPEELREEDQILYVLYLEKLFGTEISFNFGQVEPIVSLSDGAQLGGVTLTVNYQTSYQGYKKMINYLAGDSRITSIQYSTMQYDATNDVATGYLTLLCYTLDANREYTEPNVPVSGIGKNNIFR